MKKQLNTVVVTKDGWVYVLTRDQQIGLGDIDVDCQIIDLRKIDKGVRYGKAKDLIEGGMTYQEVAKELKISRPTLYHWFGKPKK